jgi:selenide,water dikinase
MYALGVVDCDNLLMLLAASTDMDEHERFVTTREIMKGFSERAKAAFTKVTGGQTVMNPWPLIGGVAMRVTKEIEMIRPENAVSGDALVLTKPLGNQIAVNLMQWLKRPSPLFERCIKGVMTEEEIVELYHASVANMIRLNRNAAMLMHKYGAHAATDVTGFGLLGHARNLCAAQVHPLVFEISALPLLRGASKASALMGDKYKLFKGLSAETSGGLLVALPRDAAPRFIAELQDIDGTPSWIIGSCRDRRSGEESLSALLTDSCSVIDV